jgi:A/G-specific adenine glycosylase
MRFSENLIAWYNISKRELPWRNTKDPYKIWLSEIILQQTKVSQGMPYYLKFLKNFPNILDLANSEEDKVLKLWQGLGYYSRARNLHFTAKYIRDNYNGVFPNNYNDILSLKGVGVYTAAAISSFAFNLSYPVVDGNVIRVLSRVFGVESEFDTGPGFQEFYNVALEMLPKHDYATHNQAIMEFGALLCKPKLPLCSNCCFNENCFALHANKVGVLPRKKKKIKIKNRFIHYLIINNKDKVFLRKKNEGIWSGLYQFPFIEFDKNISNDKVLISNNWINLFKNCEYTISSVSSPFIHKLTHQKLSVVFWQIKSDDIKLKNFMKFQTNKISDLPLSKLIDNYLTSNYII